MTKPVTPDDVVGNWNEKQTFERGDILLIATLNAGGFFIGRVSKAKPSEMVVVSETFISAAAVLAEAKRLQKKAMH